MIIFFVSEAHNVVIPKLLLSPIYTKLSVYEIILIPSTLFKLSPIKTNELFPLNSIETLSVLLTI